MNLLKELLAERADDYVKGAAKEVGRQAKEAGKTVKKTVDDVVEKGRQASFQGEVNSAIRKLVSLIKQREKLHEEQLDFSAEVILESLATIEGLDEGVMDFIKGAAGEVGRKMKEKAKAAKEKVGKFAKEVNDAGKKASEEGDMRRTIARDTKKAAADATKRSDLDAKIRTQAKKVNDLLRKRAASSGKKFKAADLKAYIRAAAGDDSVANKVTAALRA